MNAAVLLLEIGSAVMEPEIKLIFNSDIDDLKAWAPEWPEFVYMPLELTIGLPGKPGGDFFQVIVATPQALQARWHERPRVSSKGWLVVQHYDWNNVLIQLQERVARCDGGDWYEIAQKLSKFFIWQFEDYRL